MDFSQLALQKLLLNFPELSSFVVTFNDLTDQIGKDDTGINVGLFILEISGQYFFVPVVAKGQLVQPIDSIIANETQKFLPLTKSLVTTLSMESENMGQPTKTPPTVTKNPSVYELVTPPRTGKFVYASSSRLVEFLHVLPNFVKKAALEKFSEDKEIYNALHKLFGLENVLASLKPTHHIKAVIKPAIELITDGTGLENSIVQEILDKGYALRGENQTERVAVAANSAENSKFQNIGSGDTGFDYSVVSRSGDVKEAYFPRRAKCAPQFAALLSRRGNGSVSGIDEGEQIFAIFENGDYAISSSFVTRGDAGDQKNVLKTFFGSTPAITPKGVGKYDDIVMFSVDLEFIGAFSVDDITVNELGVTMRVNSLIRFKSMPVNGPDLPFHNRITINAYRNCKSVDTSDPYNIFVPINVLTAKLNRNVSSELEVNINAAAARQELGMLQALGSAVNIGYDGIEFSVDGKSLGGEIKLVERLVLGEGIEPHKAESFIKQAKEQKFVKIYLSKRADWEPGAIPEFGDAPPQQPQGEGLEALGGKFSSNVKDSLAMEDSQVAESMIISELIQAANMFDLVEEYLPEIEEAIDKLGRILFLARINIGKLSASVNSNEIMSFISNLRNVYKLLGDNYVKLEQMSTNAPDDAKTK